jgi:polyphosphate kinase 2 (PPK2 family)
MEKIYKKNVHVIKELLEQTNTDYAPWNLYFVSQDINEATAGTMKIIIDQMKQIIFNEKLKQIQISQEHKEPEIEREMNKNNEPEIEREINKSNEAEYSVVKGPLDFVDFSKSYTKKEYQKKLKKYQKKLSFAHYSLYMSKKPMVLVFEGWDAAGKGGSIKRVVQPMNPRYYHVIPIGSPTDVDQKYHYLWRFLDGIPPCGKTSIYDRSWYGRVLVERIEQLITEEEWSRAYDEINHFEKALTSDGMIVIKFWMHISKEKQYERFTARSLNPLKQWKLTEEDWRNRGKWDQYYDAVNEMILKTDTKDAPWVIIEANDKYYARIKVLKTIIKRVEKELNKEMKEADLLNR